MPEIKISGMRCEHCREAVSKALADLAGLEEVKVDLAGGTASWRDADPARPVDPEKAREAVRRIGFPA
jgi:copper chaperone CopZ